MPGGPPCRTMRAPSQPRRPGSQGVSIREHLPLVALGALLTFSSSFGQTFYVALFNQSVQAELGLTEAGIGAWYMVATLASALTLPWAGRLIDRMDLRLLLAVVFAGLAAGGLLLSQAAAIPALVLAYYLLRLSGQGMMGQMSGVVLARYIEQGRGLALGIAPLGVFGGQIVLPGAAVLGAVWLGGSVQGGWRLAWIGSAAVVALLLLPLGLALLRGHGVRHARYLQGLRDDDARAAAGTDGPAVRPSRTRAQVVRDWRFWCLVLTASCTGFVATAILFHQGWVVARMGLNLGHWASGLAVFSLAAATASPSFGWLVDRIGVRRCTPVPALLCLASSAILTLWHDLAGMYATLAVLGVANGASFVTFTPLWVELYGPRHLGAIKSLVSAFAVAATAAAPALLGLVIAQRLGLAGFGLSCSLYALLGLLVLPLGLSRKRGA